MSRKAEAKQRRLRCRITPTAKPKSHKTARCPLAAAAERRIHAARNIVTARAA
jgi:hypothetical protein